jgi:hypothetical protein
MKFRSDIDIDFGNRDSALSVLQKYTSAGIVRDGKLIKHNTGIYVTDIPEDPFTSVASLDHKIAEDRGYLKLDLLNVSLYTQIKSEQHLNDIMAQEPLWVLLQESDFFTQLIHVGSHYDTLTKMPEPVDSIVRMAMFLAVIRPAKRHLIGQTWKTVAETVWDRPEDDGYYFKKSHSVAYAHLVVMHMNLICEQISSGHN